MSEPGITESAKPLRVVSCIDSMMHTGGTELNAVRTAEGLHGPDIQLQVVTLNEHGEMSTRYAAAGIPVHVFPVTSLVSVSSVRQIVAMRNFFRRQNIDVVHAHDRYTNFLCVLAARLAGVRCVLASKRWTGYRFRRHLWTNRIAYRVADGVVTNSRSVADSASSVEWARSTRIHVIPNFVDDSLFSTMPADVRRQERAQLGFDDANFVLTIVARLRSEKRHDLLLEAFERVVRHVPVARLLIIGDGPEEAYIRARAKALDIENKVILAGHRDNAGFYHWIGDVSVLCSDHEGFPNSVVEAMAAQRPVVATAVGGVVDAVSHGETGLLVPPGDVDAMAGAIVQLSGSAELRMKMGLAGHEKARKQYQRRAVLSSLLNLYRHTGRF